MRTLSKVLFTLGILSFLIIFALKMDTYREATDYYSGEIDEAKAKLAELEQQAQIPNAEGQQFEITDDKIEKMLKINEMVTKIQNFDAWCEANFYQYAPDCYYEFEEFIDKNEEWINGLDEYLSK